MADEDQLGPVIQTIRPVRYDGNRIADEFKTLTVILKDPDPEKWDKREVAIKKIAGMAMAHEVDDEEFGRQLKQIRTALQVQVEDLRSKIVKMSAAMCVVCNEELGPEFSPTFEFLLPSFFKQLAVKAVPTRESCHQCLLTVMIASENDRILKSAMSYSGDKDKVLRTRLSFYIARVCESWDKEPLQRNLRDLLKYLAIAQADGESLVRKNAREAVASLGAHFPAGVAQFYFATEDAKHRKELEKVLPESVHEFIRANPNAKGGLAAPTTGGGRRSLNTDSRPASGMRSSYTGDRPTKKTMSVSGPREPSKSLSGSATGRGIPRSARLAGVLEDSHQRPLGRASLNATTRPQVSPTHTTKTGRASDTLTSRSRPSTSIKKYEAPKTTARELTSEEKKNRAAMLAGSHDLLSFGTGANPPPAAAVTAAQSPLSPSSLSKQSSSSSAAQPSTPSSANGSPDPNNLLARLQALRAQVQKLPDAGM